MSALKLIGHFFKKNKALRVAPLHRQALCRQTLPPRACPRSRGRARRRRKTLCRRRLTCRIGRLPLWSDGAPCTPALPTMLTTRRARAGCHDCERSLPGWLPGWLPLTLVVFKHTLADACTAMYFKSCSSCTGCASTRDKPPEQTTKKDCRTEKYFNHFSFPWGFGGVFARFPCGHVLVVSWPAWVL